MKAITPTSNPAIKIKRVDGKRPKIAIFRALDLGEMLCAIPAIRALRAVLPEAEFTLIGLPWAKDFVKRFNFYFDDFIEFPGHPALSGQAANSKAWISFLRSVQKNQFDLIIQMQGSGEVINPLISLLGAKHYAGFFVPGNYCPEPALFMPYPNGLSEIKTWLTLTEFLGAPVDSEKLEFPITQADWDDDNKIEGIRDFKVHSYICVQPGSPNSPKPGLPENFAKVADYLAGFGFKILLLGTKAEKPLTKAVANAMQTEGFDLAGETTLGALAAILNGARMLICNDSDTAQMAAALQVPSVTIFRDSDPLRWSAEDKKLHRVVVAFEPISPQLVIAQAHDLLYETADGAIWVRKNEKDDD